MSAKSQKHHREARKEEIAVLCANGHPLLVLQLYLGLRVGELISRDPSHLKEGWLNICPTSSGWRPKSETSERELPIPDTFKGALSEKMPVVITLNAQLKRITGSDLTTHGLRGAWRTASREAQLPAEMAEYLMGHAHPQQELITSYGSFNRQSKLEAMQKVWLVINKWCTEPCLKLKSMQNKDLSALTRSEQILIAHPWMKATEAHTLLAYNYSVLSEAFGWSNTEGLLNDFTTSICRASEHHARNKLALVLEYCVL